MHVSALWIYPLKGARGVPVDAALVTPRGLEGDRRWMLVGPDGAFCSARTHPAMLQITARLTPEGLHLEAPGHPPLHVPLPDAFAPRRRVQVWSSPLHLPEAVAARAWASAVLGLDAALVYQGEADHRPADPSFAPGHEVSLADAYPLLLATEASRAAVEAEAGEGLDMRRFRPNVVVAGAPHAWAEDDWPHLRIGGASFRNVKPCARCEVPTFDPDTLARSKEPLRTLARLRKQGSKVLFGANLVPLGGGRVRVGDPVLIES